jgi:hypothetical protein
MDSFRWLAVALSILLGLGVTRLLIALIDVFRSRSRARPDWVPLTWAGCIFLWQIQYWWAIAELPSLVKVWTLGSFLILVGLALLLFAAASLILPPAAIGAGASYRTEFERDGRWSLVALSAYFVLAMVTDWLFWGVSPLSRWGLFLAGLIVLPLVSAWSPSRRVQEVITVLYVPLSIAAILDLSPAAY